MNRIHNLARRSRDLTLRHRVASALLGVALVAAAIGGAYAIGSGVTAEPSDLRPQITYVTSWTLADLERHMAAGEVVAITTGADMTPAADATAAPSARSGTTAPTILAAKTTDGQFVKVEMAVTVVQAMAALRSLGYGRIMTAEAIKEMTDASTLNDTSTGPLSSPVGLIVMVAVLFTLFVVVRSRRGKGSGSGGSFKTIKPVTDQDRTNTKYAESIGLEATDKAPDPNHVTFDDVAGYEEAKYELREVVEFLKDPARFVKLGAKIPRGVMLYGPPGCGKCVTGDSLVLTDRGLLRIDSVTDRYAVRADSTVSGATLASFDIEKRALVSAAASHWYDLGEQPTLRVRTRQGAIIEGTPEHPVAVMDPSGVIVWKRLDALATTDWLALGLGTGYFGTRSDLDLETAYLLGALTGDGSMTSSNRVELTNVDDEVNAAFASWTLRHGDGMALKHRGITSYFSNWMLKQRLQSLGLESVPSWAKQVPTTVLEAPIETQCAFLRGLFDTDGGMEQGVKASLATSSPRLAQQVNSMLLNMGIVPWMTLRSPKYVGAKKAHALNISGTDLSRFADLIGFGITRKQEALGAAVAHRLTIKANTNCDLIPHLYPLLARALASRTGKSSDWLGKEIVKARHRQRVARPALSRWVSELEAAGADETLVEEVRSFIDLPIHFAPIAAITTGFARVYDFTVPGTHAFFANGVVSHNTLLGRAVAHTAGVPFTYASGSEFVEKYVGVGASRVRDLFKQARAAGTGVIFIDEIDAMAKARGGNNHQESETTLNQLLVEMDGFNTTDDIIVIAATNRIDTLDEAVLRPGRFTRKVHISLPDEEARLAIIAVHAKNKPLAEGVDMAALALKTADFSGAMLADLLNEAAIFAARRGADEITSADVDGGWLKTAIGAGRRRSMPERERAIIAAHEAGHAICGRAHRSRTVERISLYRHGDALGVTVSSATDNLLPQESDLRATLVALMGGRAAESILFRDITGGASNDLQKATEIATHMVTAMGLGRGQHEDGIRDHGRGDLGLVTRTEHGVTGEIQATWDRAIRAMLDEAYTEALATLRLQIDRLENVAAYLFEHEEIDGREFEALCEFTLRASPDTIARWLVPEAQPRLWADVLAGASASSRVNPERTDAPAVSRPAAASPRRLPRRSTKMRGILAHGLTGLAHLLDRDSTGPAREMPAE